MSSLSPLPPTNFSDTAVYQPDWAQWVRQFIAIGLVIVGVWALSLLSPVVNILITTFLLSFLMFVPARVLAARTPLHYRTCVLLMFCVILIVFLVTILVITPALFELVRSLIVRTNNIIQSVQSSLLAWDPANAATPRYFVQLPLGFQVDLTELVLPLRDALTGTDAQTALQQFQTVLFNSLPVNLNLGAFASSVASTVGTAAIALVGGLGNFLSTMIVSMLLSLIILIELPTYQNNILQSMPRHQREIRLLGNKIMHVWQAFFRGQLLLCLIIGVLTYIQLTLMGIQSAFIISVIVAAISLIPTLGGFLALVPLFILPLIQGSTTLTTIERLPLALLVVFINLIISQIIWNVVAPQVMGDAVNLPLPLIILGIIIGSAVGGVLGAFLIVPLLGMVRVIVIYLMAKVSQRDPFPDELMPDVLPLSEI